METIPRCFEALSKIGLIRRGGVGRLRGRMSAVQLFANRKFLLGAVLQPLLAKNLSQLVVKRGGIGRQSYSLLEFGLRLRQFVHSQIDFAQFLVNGRILW